MVLSSQGHPFLHYRNKSGGIVNGGSGYPKKVILHRQQRLKSDIFRQTLGGNSSFSCQEPGYKNSDQLFSISRRIFNIFCSNFDSNPGYHFPIDSRRIFALTPTLHPQITKNGHNFDQNHQFWCIFAIWPSYSVSTVFGACYRPKTIRNSI